LLAHGWTETLSIWVYVIRTLSDRGFRIVAYDLRGHGQSEPAATGDYGLARFGEDLEAVLKACVPPEQRAIVAGHSLGAMSIAAWAQHHEVERHVAGAALVNTGFGELIAQQLLFPVPPIARAVGNTIAVRGFLGSRRPPPRVSTPLDFAAIRYAAFGPSASPAQIAYYERMLLAFPPDVRAAVGLSMSDMDLYPALSRLTVPTVVIAGANDRLTPPSHGRRMTEMLPQSRGLIVLEETGHMGPLERPREISDALAELAADVVLGVGAVPA
jgi:pimeloyl-ACP methyl ester carboxylesterase